MDTISTVVAALLRPIFAFFSELAFDVGLGTPLGLWALVDGGTIHWLVAAILTPLCLLLAWQAENIRKKYLKWARITPDP